MLRQVKTVGTLALIGTGIVYNVVGTEDELQQYRNHKEFYQAEFAANDSLELDIDDQPEIEHKK